MPLFPSKYSTIHCNIPSSDLFNIISNTVQPTSNRIMADYKKGFIGTLNFPNIVFRPHYKKLPIFPWVWSHAFIKSGSDLSSSDVEVSTRINRGLKILVLVITILGLIACGFVLLNADSPKGMRAIWDPIIFLVVVWCSIYFDLKATHTKTTDLLAGIQGTAWHELPSGTSQVNEEH